MLFFERPDAGEKAILVHIDFKSDQPLLDEDLDEFQLLADTAGADVVAILTGRRDHPDPKYFIGGGKLDELRERVEHEEAELVLFNHALSPRQQRNLEQTLCKRVIDRTGLILDIFAQRARTFEGKLQVELAQLQHLSTRLVRGWTHLERQKGGIGLRGPGETQLESDRRMVRNRIKSLTQKLDKVRTQRQQSRRARKRSSTYTVALVGYTNAGKSTLFNALTQSDIYTADQLFATLDPTLRKIQVPNVGEVVLVDTVGFIRHLPHKLVEAFYATLEECCEADLLLHVVDINQPQIDEIQEQVVDVLTEIGAEKVPRLDVYNKIDLQDEPKVRTFYDDEGKAERVLVSARQAMGMEALREAISQHLSEGRVRCQVVLEPRLARLRAAFYEGSSVISERYDDAGNHLLDIELPEAQLNRLLKSEGITLEAIQPRRADGELLYR